ncbi:addiction module toxin RelE [Escherichia albertii]|uniref:Addiction module toxin RelE n=1 Tax=Escherichia albertii TaxID=208962 RepID=A0ABX5HF56_ESCAL|nr:addiction module toxin RelE [Escherichia albertii]EAB1454602.1 addiction module toxin RelE [Escherichia albertii]EEW6711753.1 addiction module toxin RelE [Escherichia albertii]EEW7342024.1 addiction module toxin RelE [Escherichia albertii]EEW7498769.1 addiction module toxin RelE [Escherichia albertii]
MPYSKSFKLHQDGKKMSPDGLTVAQSMQRQIEG